MIYAISDIHGQYDAFRALLKTIQFKSSDELYVLGDAIDRGPMPIRCLQYIMEQKNMHMLLGNHELMMLESLTINNYTTEDIWHRNGGEVTSKQYRFLQEDEKQRILSFIKELPLNFEVSANGTDYVLCHATPLCKFYNTTFAQSSVFFSYDSEKDYVVWSRRKPLPIEGKTILFGHTPTVFLQKQLKGEIAVFDGSIDIDCGAACPEYGGRLCCFCLDTQEVFYADI